MSYANRFGKFLAGLSAEDRAGFEKELAASKSVEMPSSAAGTSALGGYTYNADTATQAPSFASDMAALEAINSALVREASTGNPYPMINEGSDDPSKDMRYPFPAPAPVVVPETGTPTQDPNMGGVSDPPRELKETPAEVKDPNMGGVSDPPRSRFGDPEKLQRIGQRKMDIARAGLAEADGRKAKQRARTRLQAGHAMRKQGRIAESFRDVGERRAARIEAGEDVTQQNRNLDKRFGAALKSFGSDVATEIAGTFGGDRYGKGRKEMSDEQRDKLTSALKKRSLAKQGAREEAGNQRLINITGEGKLADKQRAAATRAREYNKQMNRQLGRASRRFGPEEVSAIAQTLGIGRYSS